MLICCLLLSWASEAQQITNNLPATTVTVPDWVRSVVLLQYNCDGVPYAATGVVISKAGHILTAAHVGKDCKGNPIKKMQVGVVNSVYGQPQKLYTATVVDRAADNSESVYDLKLLKIDNLNGAQLVPAPFATALPLPGDEISVAGFADLPFAFLSQNQASLSVYKTGILSCFAEAGNGIPTRIHYGGNTLPGLSGGPIFNSNGQLIGIHSTRSTATISKLLTTPCADAANQQSPCYGNAIRFQMLNPQNKVVTQEVHLDYAALKNVLDNYAWGTSIWRIPQQWLTQL